MKTAGKKNRSTTDNLVIMNAIIKKTKTRKYFCILYTKTYCMRMHKNASTNSG